MRLRFRAWRQSSGNQFAGNQIIEELKKNLHHKQLPADAADKSLARLARLDGETNGESVAQVGDALRKTMQAHCGVFRFADMLKQGVAKIDEVAERARHTEIRDKSRVFNTARVEALEDDKWLKHTLYFSEGRRLDYKPVRLKPLTVESFPPKARTY